MKDVRALSDAGFYLIPASNGFDAVKHFATRPVDAVIVNHRLPDIDVDDLATYFRRHKPDMPIVIISNQLPVPDALQAVDAIIQKHASGDLLVPTLLRLLDRTHGYLVPRKAEAEAA